MRKIISLILTSSVLLMPLKASALLSLELTKGVAGAIPIAVVPFQETDASSATDISPIIAADLQHSGRFKLFDREDLTTLPHTASAVLTPYFQKIGTNHVVVGQMVATDDNRYRVRFQLVDIFKGKGDAGVLIDRSYTVTTPELRQLAHHISDLIYEQITGVRGVFSTKLAYVVIQHQGEARARYRLEVADQDGHSPHTLVDSPEPIMSPAWSPNGKQLAYVSFENRQAGIYLEEVATGQRRLISSFPGINGAPAFSPDGSKLAIVLSKSGAPNLYMMDIATARLTRLTNDFYINTEPAWAPDGKSLLFTSNRAGGPQIYQIQLANHAISRVSYDGEYNARASYTHDGRHIVMIHRVDGIYKIALLDANNGRMHVLTSSSADTASPSVAPNGTMVLYDTLVANHNVLGLVSSDARVHMTMPARDGDAQDPAWSPYLS